MTPAELLNEVHRWITEDEEEHGFGRLLHRRARDKRYSLLGYMAHLSGIPDDELAKRKAVYLSDEQAWIVDKAFQETPVSALVHWQLVIEHTWDEEGPGEAAQAVVDWYQAKQLPEWARKKCRGTNAGAELVALEFLHERRGR